MGISGCGMITPLVVLTSLLRLSSALQPTLTGLPKNHEVDIKEEKFPNFRLRDAYIALQSWKKAMSSDPYGVTKNWVGPNVCDYKGVFCEQALDDPSHMVVAGIDLNHADIAGYIPAELGLLADLALVHLNSNRFRGTIPVTFANLRLLHELDISNNRFAGPFPKVLENLPVLKYLDVRFNYFRGDLPCGLFEKDLDALFLNNNKFTAIPDNFGKLPVSVMVLAHNDIEGHIPMSIGNMSRTLNEIIFSHNKMSGSIPDEIGRLKQLKVLDISSNSFTGNLPKSMRNLRSLEKVDISGNKLKGSIPGSICDLPNLRNFTFGHNYFQETPEECQPFDQKKDFPIDSRRAHSKTRPCSPCHPHSTPTTSILVPQSHPPATAPTPMPLPTPIQSRPSQKEDYAIRSSRMVTPRLTCKSLFHFMLFRCAFG